MNTLKTLFIIALLGTSVSAMAEGGGDRTMALMLAHNEAVMQQHQQEEAQGVERSKHEKSVVSAHDAASSETDRSE
ncbi:co-regulatory protein PtrA N-terminal domain-containing protein [Pseudomonas sp. CCI3.2]|uniref:co-regulatory protein PtrA N-terminal domain-containing protein n=1 Tax=unclassified Pseudomonas TaxID=196821 RepID=UPI002AC8F10C|nr:MULTISPECIES: co-regulatory protein PtrA N-terminal domain-containing protein [unclassified Pseudomonas]MEB0079659.1 co-regulatory protein PtrA N-terminal domain-containing protein [Pseudomonas sp. MH10out]MEB0093400.1 co-regulatory protein PtrA N-terminal domain-containing protein [Pseudomonas sp. CCI4.2]MEB0102283.1 co-regulatory protein PtrA N-terminal domain-containing protein [Pseudomonas sp. CCI3.2]MEB0129415.1 co-regulatory protein PtrA N-terminal domain-containing protein [Pseudomona